MKYLQGEFIVGVSVAYEGFCKLRAFENLWSAKDTILLKATNMKGTIPKVSSLSGLGYSTQNVP